MKIKMIVHSKTGNTEFVAEKLKEKLLKNGHFVEMEKIEPVGGENTNEADISKIVFAHLPEVFGFDKVIFCAPVRGFSISPVMAAFLSKIDSLKDQKVDLFVTQFFPYPCMGGKHAISQMKDACEKKGAIVVNTGIINWKNKKREKIIENLVERFSK